MTSMDQPSNTTSPSSSLSSPKKRFLQVPTSCAFNIFPRHKPQITEIQVRMDCYGCVQKIKKALSGIHGICDLYIDLPQQKITVVGWADQEKIVKAIKKTRKTATICPLVEPMESPSQLTELEPAAPEGNEPVPHPAQQPPAETPPQAEPPEEIAPPELPPPEVTTPTESQKSESIPGTKDAGEVHQTYQHPPTYANRFDSGHNIVGCWNR